MATNDTSSVRGLLLEALGLGEWEAGHLTGVELARQVVARVQWCAERMAGMDARIQRLACDVQELQSGEAWDEARERLACAEEVARRYVELRQAVCHVPGEPDGHSDDDAHDDVVAFARELARQFHARVRRSPAPRPFRLTGESWAADGPRPSALDGED